MDDPSPAFGASFLKYHVAVFDRDPERFGFVASDCLEVESRADPMPDFAHLHSMADFARLHNLDSATNESTSACNATTMELRMGELTDYLQCTRDKEETIDRTVPGSEWHGAFECWCQFNVKQTVEAEKCCDHESYEKLCDVKCDAAACDSWVGRACLAECPALCLEEHHAPAGCAAACEGCWPYMKCITAKGEADVRSGAQARVCDVPAWEASPELTKSEQCTEQHPLRTNWNRFNAKEHCACEHGVEAASERHHCCDASFIEDWCDPTRCLTTAECETEEARSCAAHCQTACIQIGRDHLMRQPAASRLHATCNPTDSICIDKEGECAKYKSCMPVDQPPFDYVCTDGSSPMDNGCCLEPDSSGAPAHRCPRDCTHGAHHQMVDAWECECYGCPMSPPATTAPSWTCASEDYSNESGTVGACRSPGFLLMLLGMAMHVRRIQDDVC